jgi:hypothetical protein
MHVSISYYKAFEVLIGEALNVLGDLGSQRWDIDSLN